MSRLAEQFDLLSNLPDPFEHNPNIEFTTTEDWRSEEHPRRAAGRNLSIGPEESVERMGTLAVTHAPRQSLSEPEVVHETIRFPVQQHLFVPEGQRSAEAPRPYYTFYGLSELQDTPPIDPSTGFAHPVGPQFPTPSNPHVAKIRAPKFDVSVTHGLPRSENLPEAFPARRQIAGSFAARRHIMADVETRWDEHGRVAGGYVIQPEGKRKDTLSSIFMNPTHEDNPNDPETGRPPYRNDPMRLAVPYASMEADEPPEMQSWVEWSSDIEGQGDLETFPAEIAKHYGLWQEEQDKFRRRVHGG